MDVPGFSDELPHGSPDGDPTRRKPGEGCATRNGAQARLIAEVARMYYEERRTQLEIAKNPECIARYHLSIFEKGRETWHR